MCTYNARPLCENSNNNYYKTVPRRNNTHTHINKRWISEMTIHFLEASTHTRITHTDTSCFTYSAFKSHDTENGLRASCRAKAIWDHMGVAIISVCVCVCIEDTIMSINNIILYKLVHCLMAYINTTVWCYPKSIFFYFLNWEKCWFWCGQ